eukprot:TRINITY_DN20469_c0_g1_i1.p1 TRINITY_DN20469_c0_g1~~TRINITY_DN20469_c0_g1_i1.p1  ORF type:complete len:132 (-),score=22.11 TRINITY_DN20469_c0_g1_i1:338-733(-)
MVGEGSSSTEQLVVRYSRHNIHADSELEDAGRPSAMEVEPAAATVVNSKEKEKRERLCKRCKVYFDPETNSQESCRFHPSMFVCRRHDDQKRYYELKDGDPPYEAKFYDCCGAEDPMAPGCRTNRHLTFDE